MPSTAQLEAQGRQLAKSIKDINADETKTAAEKKEALAKIEPDFKAHQAEVEAHERAQEMLKSLGGADAAKDGLDNDIPEVEVRNLKQIRKHLARAVIMNPELKNATSFEKGTKFDVSFNVSAKAADPGTAAAELMGAFADGETAPAAIGQNPFGSTGTFAPGILPTFLPGIVEQLFYELSLADLISSRPVTSPNLSYLTESAAHNNAAAVAEAGTYPFSSEEFARVYEQVGKVANALTITDEGLRDAPELFNFVQGRLLEGIQRKEEVQLLAGGGYPGVNGLLQRSTGFTASSASSLFGATSATVSNVKFPADGTNGAFVGQDTVASLKYGRVVTGAAGSGSGVAGSYPTAAEIAENVFDAFVDIQLTLFQTPNAVVMNPRDWELLRLTKDANGQYMGGNFFGNAYGNPVNGGKNIWGVPVVTTPLIPLGTILVGHFAPSVIQTARREGVTMQMTNSNGTDFVDGKVTVRAEERLGLLVYRPSAFQLIQLKKGATGS
ncbi:major head protein [Mycobacterium phage Quink]|uniref:Major capsid protein n=6 Tax=Kostyavirus TaxID=1623284 RepID=Q857Z9_9CAUD|nr:major head protein [Mycobacterium phage Cjw1]YP_002014332.1 major head protein [Mycobacterium phage Porky]YP_008051948.1 major head protein [Mycobacterium phage Phrux]YP_008409406.1 major head protein [Mycobacterium phage DrDrey]YP_008531089.1 major head protein [Mycobacterium phage Quink]YP_009011773.1 major head protein [Mycobacterium phage Lilac]YP_654768.1 major head protein [Mycobacterium phage 244]AEL21771.1 major capsid protein [Mycobacterium phage Elph10]ALA06244.1 major capsid p